MNCLTVDNLVSGTIVDGIYVYCVARMPRAAGPHAPSPRIFGPIGLDGRVVYTLACGDGQLCAVVHDCQAQPYQSKDPQAVEGWVVAHQNVILAASEAFGTVLPMAFDMIVKGGECGQAPSAEWQVPREEEAGRSRADGRGIEDCGMRNADCGMDRYPSSSVHHPASDIRSPVDALAAWLDEKRDRFIRLLDKLDGKAEYGVQVFWDRQQVAASLIQSDVELRQLRDEAAGKPRGAAHLLGQRLAKAARAALERQADLFAQDWYNRIRRCVADVRIEQLKKDEGGGNSRQMLLNLSCLVQRGSGEERGNAEFGIRNSERGMNQHPASDSQRPGSGEGGACGLGRVLDEIQQTPGVSVRFTGPWPPYSFVGG